MTIACPAHGEETLVDGFAGTVTAGAPLVVADGETSVFVRDGQPLRVVGPGRYQVPPELAGPGIAVYFVRTAPLGVRFGGPIPARPGGPRAVFGEVTVHVVDPCAVASRLAPIGTGTTVMAWLRAQLQRAVADAAAARGADPARLGSTLVEHARDLAGYGVAIAHVGSITAR